jgi:hypothetical protein
LTSKKKKFTQTAILPGDKYLTMAITPTWLATRSKWMRQKDVSKVFLAYKALLE